MTYPVLLAALLPIAVLAFYIYQKDSMSPEPTGQLLKGFFYGILSAPLSFCISIPFLAIGLFPEVETTICDAIATSFFGAAIPEECAKLFMLWLLLRKNKHFDEKMDGIVYAVCVSLGFAALENVIYLFDNYDEWVLVGVSRALTAVPGHFGFGILMGYYYSLAKFYPHAQQRNKILIIAAPVLAHGAYDSILFTMQVNPALSGILTILFLVFCHKLWKYGSTRIAEHLERDKQGSIIQ